MEQFTRSPVTDYRLLSSRGSRPPFIDPVPLIGILSDHLLEAPIHLFHDGDDIFFQTPGPLRPDGPLNDKTVPGVLLPDEIDADDGSAGSEGEVGGALICGSGAAEERELDTPAPGILIKEETDALVSPQSPVHQR